MVEKDEEFDTEQLRDDVEDLEKDLDKVLDNSGDDEGSVASGNDVDKDPVDKLLLPPSYLKGETAKKLGCDLLLMSEKIAFLKKKLERKRQKELDEETIAFSKWMNKEEDIDTQVTELLENELKKDLYSFLKQLRGNILTSFRNGKVLTNLKMLVLAANEILGDLVLNKEDFPDSLTILNLNRNLGLTSIHAESDAVRNLQKLHVLLNDNIVVSKELCARELEGTKKKCSH